MTSRTLCRPKNASAPGALLPTVTPVTGHAEGFEYRMRGDEVVISHHGRPATVLRGSRAAQFVADVEREDPQELMARVTGNYKRGNERTAKNHPRNRRAGA